jgi:hypothetical protein
MAAGTAGSLLRKKARLDKASFSVMLVMARELRMLVG